jgi:hypothetical protein
MAIKGLTQNQFLEQHLRGTGRELTVAQARQLGIKNLRARVCELRNDYGLNVQSRKNYRGAGAFSMTSRDISGSRAKVFA